MIGETIASFAVTVTRRTYAPGARVAGRWVPGAATDTPFECVVAPASPRELLKLEEGERTKEARTIYSETALTPGDDLVINARVYEVKTCDDWEDQGAFFVSIAVKKDQQTHGAQAVTLNSATQAGTGNVS